MTRPPEPGRVCAIETSSRSGSVALSGADGPRELRLERERAHASDLLPALESLRREVAPTPPALEAIVFGSGPGSYTGLRVGIATALGLARGFDAALRAVPSFEALAFGELTANEEGTVFWNARAGAYYFARYRRLQDDVQVLEPPCAVALEEALRRLPAQGKLFCDASTKAEWQRAAQAGSLVASEALPAAGALLRLGWKRLNEQGAHSPQEVAPLYLRDFGQRP